MAGGFKNMATLFESESSSGELIDMEVSLCDAQTSALLFTAFQHET